MITRLEKDLFDRCLKAWGLNSQLLMLGEECTELTLECFHIVRSNRKVTLKRLGEEIADVELMLKEIKYYHRETDLQSLIDSFDVRKKERLEKLLKTVKING